MGQNRLSYALVTHLLPMSVLILRSLAVCVGHEIVGHAVKVGKNVTHVKVGDRVGVGAQSDAVRFPFVLTMVPPPHALHSAFPVWTAKQAVRRPACTWLAPTMADTRIPNRASLTAVTPPTTVPQAISSSRSLMR